MADNINIINIILPRKGVHIAGGVSMREHDKVEDGANEVVVDEE